MGFRPEDKDRFRCGLIGERRVDGKRAGLGAHTDAVLRRWASQCRWRQNRRRCSRSQIASITLLVSPSELADSCEFVQQGFEIE